jgi:hypothetical protein
MSNHQHRMHNYKYPVACNTCFGGVAFPAVAEAGGGQSLIGGLGDPSTSGCAPK